MSLKYSIGTVSRLTGLSPARIRAWETRYQAITPPRTATGRRSYDDTTLSRLRLLADAVAQGHGISRIASLPEKELRHLVDMQNERDSKDGAKQIVPRILDNLKRLDLRFCDAEFAAAFVHLDPWHLVEDVLTPLLGKARDMYRRKELSAAQVRLLSNLIRMRLCASIQVMPTLVLSPRILFATLAGDSHETGALMACYLAQASGADAEFIGCDMDSAQIAEIAVGLGCDAVAVSVTVPPQDNDAGQQLTDLRQRLPGSIALWIGGDHAVAVGATIAADNCVPIESNIRYREELAKLALR